MKALQGSATGRDMEIWGTGGDGTGHDGLACKRGWEAGHWGEGNLLSKLTTGDPTYKTPTTEDKSLVDRYLNLASHHKSILPH